MEWLSKKGYVPSMEDVASFALQIGWLTDGFYQSCTVQGYEYRDIRLLPSEPMPMMIDVNELPLDTIPEAGVEFIVDVNNRPDRSPKPLGVAVQNVFQCVSTEYKRIASRALNAIGVKV